MYLICKIKRTHARERQTMKYLDSCLLTHGRIDVANRYSELHETEHFGSPWASPSLMTGTNMMSLVQAPGL